MSLKTGNAKKYHVWVYNKCHEINLSDPLGYFLFYVILTISYFRAWTIEMSSLPTIPCGPWSRFFLVYYLHISTVSNFSIDMLWFKFSFLLFQTQYHVIIIHYHTQKQKKRKFEPRINWTTTFGGREATTGNASVVRRLSHRKIYVRTSTRLATASIK